MACVERCVLLGSARIRPGGAGRECASKTRRPFLWRSQVRRLDPDERAHDRGLVADCLATRRPWTPCVLSVRARPLFVLVAAGMCIFGKSLRVELLAALCDSCLSSRRLYRHRRRTWRRDSSCAPAVPPMRPSVLCFESGKISHRGMRYSPGTCFLHSLPHKSGEHALAQRGWSFCLSSLGRCRFLKDMTLYDTRAEAGHGSFSNGLAADAAE